MYKKFCKCLSIILCLACASVSLTGCSNNQNNVTTDTKPIATKTATVIPTIDANATVVPTTPSPEVSPEPTTETAGMTAQQKNAINMLNYLRALAQDIRSSSNSRVYLEECYSSLLNNTHPNAVDQATLDEVMSLLDTLEKYRMIAVKRERLQYIYEQNKAQAIRDAIPNPLGLLSAVGSYSPAKIAASVLYMAVDSITSYQSSSSAADLQYLQDGWQLDDEQATALHNSRKQLFSYMINMVNSFDLPGDLALNEDLIDEFVSWKNNDNVVRRIQFLESNQGTYQSFGQYWIVLAKSYYENEDYGKCLNAIKAYENLDMHIFRNDYDYAEVLPMAIISTGYTMGESEYVSVACDYCQKIIDNTNNEDWSLRYFVAQIYIDLYGKTGDKAYLQLSYDVTLNNVNQLVDEQRTMNSTYLSDVVEQTATKGETETAKKEREQYNKMLKEERKTELAPLSEPLLLNCELLFAVANELNIPEAEQQKINSMLHMNGEPLFLIEPIDSMFRYEKDESSSNADAFDIAFTGSEISIPVKYISEDAEIMVAVAGADGQTRTYDAWTISKVDRKSKDDIASFVATFKCSNTTYSDGDTIMITITPKPGLDTAVYTFQYKAEKTMFLFIQTGISFNKTAK